tara:strand:+ start:203 stop:511 length:309 start_codon:yes stop_codon:yes gene_type:complete
MSIRDQYVFITTEKDTTTQYIGIRKGRFEGVVYRYNEISTKENANGTLTLKFEYDIVDNNMIPKKEFDNDEFFNLLGDILVDVIDRGGNTIGDTNDRENSSQ